MLDFLTIAITFPAVPFTLAVALSTVFWLVSIVGGLELGGVGAEGALDGVGEAADGAADALAGGIADGATEGALDGSDTESGFGGLGFAGAVLGLGRVPLTLWVSLFSLWGWILAFVGGWFLRSPLLVFLPTWPGNLLVLAVATVGGVVLARITSRPLEPVYRSHAGRGRASLVGEVAEITTSRVDARFGQARIEIGGDDLVVQVRCDAGNPLTRGGRALVVQFDSARDAFVVEPLADATGRVAARDTATGVLS